MEFLTNADLAEQSRLLGEAICGIFPRVVSDLVDEYARGAWQLHEVRRLMYQIRYLIFRPHNTVRIPFTLPGFNNIMQSCLGRLRWAGATISNVLRLKMRESPQGIDLPITAETLWDFLCGAPRGLYEDVHAKIGNAGEVATLRAVFRAAFIDYHTRRRCAARARLLRGGPTEGT